MKVLTGIHFGPHITLQSLNVLQIDIPAAWRLLQGINSRVATTLIQVIRGQRLDTCQQQTNPQNAWHFIKHNSYITFYFFLFKNLTFVLISFLCSCLQFSAQVAVVVVAGFVWAHTCQNILISEYLFQWFLILLYFTTFVSISRMFRCFVARLPLAKNQLKLVSRVFNFYVFVFNSLAPCTHMQTHIDLHTFMCVKFLAARFLLFFFRLLCLLISVLIRLFF